MDDKLDSVITGQYRLRYSPQGITATSFDDHSIMLYQFDAALFTDGKGTPNNTHLSARDETFIAQMYPKA